MKARKHTLAITVTFDKACAASWALREVKDSIHGEFYPTPRTDNDPGLFRVKGFSRIASKRQSSAISGKALSRLRQIHNLERPLVGRHE